MVTGPNDTSPADERADVSLVHGNSRYSETSDTGAYSARQARYWIGTIPKSSWEPHLPDGVSWVRGQLEKGERTDYEHWQICFSFSSKKSLGQVKRSFPDNGHYEPTRSSAAEQYVWKSETRIGDPFEFGTK